MSLQYHVNSQLSYDSRNDYGTHRQAYDIRDNTSSYC